MIDQQMSSKRAARIRRTINLVALFILSAILFSWGNKFSTPGIDLDFSWNEALVQATDHQRHFGVDTIFTFGPYHQVYTNQISNNLGPILIGRFVLGLAFGAMITSLAMMTSMAWGFTIAIALGLAIPQIVLGISYDPLMPLLNGIFLLASIFLPATLACELLLLAMYAGIIIGVFAKLSFLGAAIISIPAGLIGRALIINRKRRLPLWLVASGALLLPASLWVASGQPIQNLSTYLLADNLDIIRGYSAAMSTTSQGNSWQIALYFVASLLCLSMINRYLRAHLNRASKPADHLLRAALLLSLALLSWLTFKASMTRHDMHAITAGMFIFGLGIISVALDSTTRPNAAVTSNAPLGYAFLLTAGLVIASTYNGVSTTNPIDNIKAKLANTKLWLYSSLGSSRHTNYLRLLRQMKLKSIGQEEESFAMPRSATADILNWDVISLAARPLTYSPRPIFQSYSAYTPRLQHLNYNFFHSAKRPQYVVLRLQSIDNRVPFDMDGPALFAIASHYSFDSYGSKGSLVYKANEQPVAQADKAPVNRVQPSGYAGLLGSKKVTLISTTKRKSCQTGTCFATAPVTIRSSSETGVIGVYVKPNSLGKLMSAIFKPGQITVRVSDDDTTHSYRIIPGAINIIPLRRLDSNRFKAFMESISAESKRGQQAANQAGFASAITFEIQGGLPTIQSIAILENPDQDNLFSIADNH